MAERVQTVAAAAAPVAPVVAAAAAPQQPEFNNPGNYIIRNCRRCNQELICNPRYVINLDIDDILCWGCRRM